MENSKAMKIILLGESGVGKTNLINVSCGRRFDPDTNSTVVSSFSESSFEHENKKYFFNLWDTAGQERYRSLNKIFIKGSKIIMVVFAIDNQVSFDQVDYWIEYTKQILSDEKYILALVANKSDLFEEQVISDEDIIKKAKDHNIKYIITSACCDSEGFKLFIYELILDYVKIISPHEAKELHFQLDIKESNNDKKEKSKKCC